jgi:hypothetical protein
MCSIKASCPVCGDVELAPPQLRLVFCTRRDWSYYAFTCPMCCEEVLKPACEDVAALLLSGGVRVERWHVPAEACEEKTGPAITYDDVLDFALNLDRLDAEARALR